MKLSHYWRLFIIGCMCLVMVACKPWADFTYSPTPVVAGVETTFDASSSFIANPNSRDPHGKHSAQATYAWDFGDGTAAGSGKIVQYTFAAAGSYQVKLVVTNAKGESGTATQTVVVLPRPKPAVAATIPATGGVVTLPDYATVSFPSGVFPSAQKVTLSATSTEETKLDFDSTALMFEAGVRAKHELRINTGSVKPSTGFEAVIAVPKEFLDQVPANSEIKVFAQIFQDGGEEILDSFELFESTYSSANGTVTVTLPPEAFTNRRTIEASYEAVFLLATTPTKPDATSLKNTLRVASLDAVTEISLPQPPDAFTAPAIVNSMTTRAVAICQGGSLGSPIDNRQVTSPFNGTTHFGTDYRAAEGTTVRAMADGVVERIAFDARPLPVPDPRSGKLVKGWGQYVVIKHTDGSRTLYAHLTQNSALKQTGSSVKQGDPIALSGNTGGSSGPHLHAEYAPNGKIYDKSAKSDPEPCIDQNGTGSVTVSDNGSVADDAFSVAINGLVVCQTTIGASNTCFIGNLRAGNATLTLTAVIAPDDVGTYQISLADGLTFSDGSVTRSSTLPQGGSTSFAIVIPPKQ